MEQAEILLSDSPAGKEAQRAHLLTKLRQVFKDGYRPTRNSNEYYNTTLKNGAKAYENVNCFGHIFNLHNQQFDDYQFGPYKMYGYFPGIRQSIYFREQAIQRTFDFVKAAGLEIEPCAPDKKIIDFESWKVALYFHVTPWHKDFHFLLQDAPQKWSSKLGFNNYMEYIHEATPPKIYRNLVENKPDPYELYGTYKITNPNADIHNPYIQDRTY